MRRKGVAKKNENLVPREYRHSETGEISRMPPAEMASGLLVSMIVTNLGKHLFRVKGLDF